MEFPPFVDMEFPPFVLRLSKYERGERAEKSTLKPVIPALSRRPEIPNMASLHSQPPNPSFRP